MAACRSSLGNRTNGFSARDRWFNETGARIRAAVRFRSSTSERSKRGTQFGPHRWVRCVVVVYVLTPSRWRHAGLARYRMGEKVKRNHRSSAHLGRPEDCVVRHVLCLGCPTRPSDIIMTPSYRARKALVSERCPTHSDRVMK